MAVTSSVTSSSTSVSTADHLRIANDLLGAVHDGELPIGARLPSDRLLAEQYGVEIVSAERALTDLARRQIIRRSDRGHYTVSVALGRAIRRFGLLDLLEAREVLEIGAVRLASARIRIEDRRELNRALTALDIATATHREAADRDLELHRAVIGLAGSERLTSLWNQLTAEISRAAPLGPHGRGIDRSALEQHRLYATGVMFGQPDKALDACATMHADHRWLVRALIV
jgi:GntR family transcriptional regulator, transcriptional repressor for pyruvate dehydrogenase complex